MRSTDGSRKQLWQKLAVPLLLCVLFLQLALSVRKQAQTYDEGFHLVAGYRYWQCGDFGINSEHPPLVKFVAAAPLYLGSFPAPSPADDCGREPTTKDYGYSLGFNYLYKQGLNADALLFRARIAAAVFSVVLALACYFTARTFFGNTAALLALLLLVFEPNVLAHGALITTDIAVSAFLLLSVLAFYRYATNRSLAGWVLAGVFTGFAFAAKHSAVLIVPILCLLVVTEFLLRKPAERRARELIFGLVGTFAVALLVLWGAYGLRYSARPAHQPMTNSVPGFLQAVQEQGTTGPLVATIIPGLARYHLLPEAYLYGFVDVLNVTHPGLPPFILGKLYAHGKWFYFPVAFVIKSTAAFLIFCALAVFAVRWRRRGHLREVLYLVIPIAVVFVAGMESGLNIGYRHIMPIIPFLCVLIGGAAAHIARRSPRWKMAAALLFVWHGVSSLHAYPNYLPYANEFWGGPTKTYRYLTDANVDWGQGVKQLAEYLQRNNIHDCWIAYDGALSLTYYNVKCRPMPGNIGDAPPQVPPDRATGIFIISSLSLSGIEWEPGDLNPYLEFQRTNPTKVVAGGMLIYRGTFDLRSVAAVSHIARTLQANNTGKCDEAIPEAQSAATITPNSVRAHLVLGQALSACKRSEEAKRELKTALNLASARPEWYPFQIAEAQRGLKALLSP